MSAALPGLWYALPGRLAAAASLMRPLASRRRRGASANRAGRQAGPSPSAGVGSAPDLVHAGPHKVLVEAHAPGPQSSALDGRLSQTSETMIVRP
jgi:hypothetical protein